MIPQEKSAAVSQALSETFGVTSFENLCAITAGRSPGVLVFRIVVEGRPLILRIIMRTDDATRHFTCMKAAAEAGLAPRVWYTSIQDRISITDYVETVPFRRTDALAESLLHCGPCTRYRGFPPCLTKSTPRVCS